MKIIKLTHPLNWQRDDLPSNYLGQTPNQLGVWEDYQFEINNDCNECDYWIINGDINQKEEKVNSKFGTFFITSEEKASIQNYNNKFLAQFDVIITSRDDIQHPQIIRTQYLCPWQVGKSYDQLKDKNISSKPKILSAVVSDMVRLEGHKKRFAFMNQLKGHFKQQLDWYSRENKYVQDKWNGLAEYQYSIAIENSSFPNYWTEKLADCFLAETMPIYWGCPNILDYFPEKSMIFVDIDNFEVTVEKIERAIKENWYKENYESIIEAKNLILNKYQFIPTIVNILKQHKKEFRIKNKSSKIYIQEKYSQISLQKRILNKIKSTIFKK